MIEVRGLKKTFDGFAALDALCAFAGTPIPAPLDALRDAGVEVTGYEKGYLRSGAAAPWLLRRAKALAAQS